MSYASCARRPHDDGLVVRDSTNSVDGDVSLEREDDLFGDEVMAHILPHIGGSVTLAHSRYAAVMVGSDRGLMKEKGRGDSRGHREERI